jgi:hypothetical protein
MVLININTMFIFLFRWKRSVKRKFIKLYGKYFFEIDTYLASQEYSRFCARPEVLLHRQVITYFYSLDCVFGFNKIYRPTSRQQRIAKFQYFSSISGLHRGD